MKTKKSRTNVLIWEEIYLNIGRKKQSLPLYLAQTIDEEKKTESSQNGGCV